MLTNVKTLSTVMLLSAALAAPAFAHTSNHHAYGFRGAYNQVGTPSASQGAIKLENFGLGGRDPSRVGGYDPTLNPSGS